MIAFGEEKKKKTPAYLRPTWEITTYDLSMQVCPEVIMPMVGLLTFLREITMLVYLATSAFKISHMVSSKGF